MKRSRLFGTTILLAVAMLTVGCSDPVPAGFLPDPEDIVREGENIESILFKNIPNEIPVGSANDFDKLNIYLEITYSSGATEQYPVRWRNLSQKMQEMLQTVGRHTVTIAFRGQEIETAFNIVAGVEAWTVRYLTYDGVLLYEEKVTPGHKISYIPEGPSRKPDSLFIYDFSRWDKEISDQIVADNMDIFPLYNKKQKRYYVLTPDPTTDTLPYRVVYYPHNDYYHSYELYIHLGRIERVPLLYKSPAIHHNEGTEDTHTYTLGYNSSNIDGELNTLAASLYNKTINFPYNESTASHIWGDRKGLVHAGSDAVDKENSTHIELRRKTSFEDHYADAYVYDTHIREFVENSTDNAYEFDFKVPGESQTSWYRGAVEASIDVTLVMKYMLVNPSGTIDVDKFTIYFTYDPATVVQVVEYDEHNEDFIPTADKRIQLTDESLRDIVYYAYEHGSEL